MYIAAAVALFVVKYSPFLCWSCMHLLSLSSSTGATLQFRMTPMHLAVNGRDVAAVRELLQLNCDLSLRDEVRKGVEHNFVHVHTFAVF